MWKYYITEDDKYAMEEETLWSMCDDPYLAIMMRYAGLEAGERGIELEDGTVVWMDESERRVMAQQGTLQTGQYVRRTLALHIKERFTDVFATDGSKKGDRAAYGVWEGPGAVSPERRQEGGAEDVVELERRMAAGMHGGKLPTGWGVTEAEMAAVIRALQIARSRDDGTGPGRRVMICTDSQATMRAMETAWRTGRHTGVRVDRTGLVATMVELRRELSREREGGQERGCVRMVYTPGHRGIAPNAIADAVAKAYLDGEEDGGVIWEVIQQAVHVRPYVWGREDGMGGWEGPDDRRINVQVREGIMEWIREEHQDGGQYGRTTAGLGKGEAWGDVMRAVAKGGEVALLESKGKEGVG